MDHEGYVTAGPVSRGAYVHHGPSLASEPELTAHARTCTDRDEHGERQCGGSVWCAFCNTFYYGGVVCRACRDCRDRWATYPATLPPGWVATVRAHASLEVSPR